MRILFILEYYYPNIGGVEKLFKDLAENLVVNGHEIMVITNRFDSSLKKEETINGVKIKRLNLKNRFAFTFFSNFGILPYVNKVDVIHTTSYNAAFPAWLTAKIFRKKSVITFHEVWGDLWKKLPYLNPIQKKLYSVYEWMILQLKFDHYIAISEFTKKKLIEHGIPQKRIELIYNGINLQEFKKKEEQEPEKFVFTFFGRLGISKGLDILIPAAKTFITKHPGCIFKLIIPKTPKGFYNELMDKIAQLQFGDNIQILHHLEFQELKNEISNSSCVVIPSYSEGFCFAAVETVALGVPIISSNLGALQETVSGKHIHMRSHTETELVDALERAINNDFDHIPEKEFKLQDSIKLYLSFYQNLIN